MALLRAGIGLTQNSMRSKPCGPVIWGRIRSGLRIGAFQLSGASSALTALLSFSADLVRRAGEFGRGSAVDPVRFRAARLGFTIGAGIDHATSAAYFAASAARTSNRRQLFAPEAPRKLNKPLLDAFKAERIEIRRHQRRPEVLVGLLQRMMAASIAFTAGSTSAGEFPARRSSRRTAADSAGTGE